MIIEGRTALITGGGSGIGKAISLTLAKAGVKVGVLDMDKASAMSVRDEIIAMGGQAGFYVADIGDSASASVAMDQLESELGPLGIMVNCAGIGSFSLLYEMDDEEWLRVMNVNFNGTFYYCRESAKRMIPRKWGRIINISSMAAKRISVFGSGAYTATKTGVLGLTRHLSYEVARYGITVNAICPDSTETPMTLASKDSKFEDRRRWNPSGRNTNVDDHANLVKFLASEESSMINGQAIDVDGGSQLGWMSYDKYLEIRQNFSKK